MKNWGSKIHPGPTLNLVQRTGSICQGLAFEFLDSASYEVLQFLGVREGKGFTFDDCLIFVDGKGQAQGLVPIYRGENILNAIDDEEIVTMVLQAKGTSGYCVDYVLNIDRRLMELGIKDQAVDSLFSAIKKRRGSTST